MRYYIATRLENYQQHRRLRDALNALGHLITYDWTEHGAVWGSGLEKIQEVAGFETEGVEEADEVIVLWPGGRGTHVEMGMALALRKRVVLISGEEGHHEASPETCAFYHHWLVRRFRSLEQYLAQVPEQSPAETRETIRPRLFFYEDAEQGFTPMMGGMESALAGFVPLDQFQDGEIKSIRFKRCDMSDEELDDALWDHQPLPNSSASSENATPISGGN